MIPAVGENAPNGSALLCDGEQFQEKHIRDLISDNGLVLVFYGFSFSAIAENWWKYYERRGWHQLEDTPVVGVSRDGPYAQNAFIRELETPFQLFSDVAGELIETYDLLVERDGMGSVETANRAIFVLNSELLVKDRWIAETWTEPVPVDRIEPNLEFD
jgi:peroxiredoxin